MSDNPKEVLPPAAAPDKEIKKSNHFNRLSELAREARAQDKQEIGLCPREFVLCGLPCKRPSSLVHERRDGSFALRVEGDPRHGLPYGQDRLLLIWLATAFYAARCPKDNTIHFRAAADILKTFGLGNEARGGSHFQRLKGRLDRLQGATYHGQDRTKPGRRAGKSEGYRLIEHVSLGEDRKAQPNQHTCGQNKIELSEDFARDLRKAVVPVDLQTVRALKQHPAVLDLYLWQTWRSYRYGMSWGISSPRNPDIPSLKIPVFGPEGLLKQLGSAASTLRKQRQLLREWQGLIQKVWPECPNSLSEDGDTFLIRPAQALFFPEALPYVGVGHLASLTPRNVIYPREFYHQVPYHPASQGE